MHFTPRLIELEGTNFICIYTYVYKYIRRREHPNVQWLGNMPRWPRGINLHAFQLTFYHILRDVKGACAMVYTFSPVFIIYSFHFCFLFTYKIKNIIWSCLILYKKIRGQFQMRKDENKIKIMYKQFIFYTKKYSLTKLKVVFFYSLILYMYIDTIFQFDRRIIAE